MIYSVVPKMKMNQSDGLTTVSELIATWNLNRPILASKMGMNVTTFKNKINPSLPAYRLTESEEQKLYEVLRELAADIEIVIGISFNKALSAIVKKKA